MRHSVSPFRAAVTVLLLAGVVAGSGCSWFRKGNKLYAESPEMRPLEVPPDLDRPTTSGAVDVPAPRAGAQGGAAAGAAGFAVAGSREEVFAKVGEALAAVEGATVSSRAEALGVYDVNYRGSNFLVRVSATDGGAQVSAVDPRGQPAAGDAPKQLIDALRTALGGR
ncbi:hypothetical protein [Vulcaniibacterium tengchongense]|uniref:Beta-barrel assembly machine subunit BamC n=1 Tax=Vulcaniibacterium tengchongense TaxID=1273429 RepID=A0A3N4VED7_9GAMM|nr:hypothetical protein [Vulcaniibacterium tengchongense]RPE81352.1 Beta-barrel assembly machine subunit BamC [Vulcaniibacterium tengchongense]